MLTNTCWAYRPHPNECSGGDLDGDLFFISWDKDLIPPQTDNPMDYTGRRPRIMDHKVTLEVIFQPSFVIFYLFPMQHQHVEVEVVSDVCTIPIHVTTFNYFHLAFSQITSGAYVSVYVS